MSIKELIDTNFRGDIYIVQDTDVLYESATGFADLMNEIPNSLDTKFASASGGKVFVAVGILQLIERGRIKFDDTLGKLLDINQQDIMNWTGCRQNVQITIFIVQRQMLIGQIYIQLM